MGLQVSPIIVLILCINSMLIIGDVVMENPNSIYADNSITKALFNINANNLTINKYDNDTDSIYKNLPREASTGTEKTGEQGVSSSFGFVDVIKLVYDVVILLIGLAVGCLTYWYSIPSLPVSVQFLLTIIFSSLYILALVKLISGRGEL